MLKTGAASISDVRAAEDLRPSLLISTMAELVDFAKSGNLVRVRECVLRGGHDVNFRQPPDGSTPLYWAACSGHVFVCDWLIQNGAEVDLATTKSGSSAIHGATDRGHYDCVALLIKRGSHINKQTTGNGDTALHLAAYRGDLSICRLLLENGANTSLVNKQGRTAFEESEMKNHHDISRLLGQYNGFQESTQASITNKTSVEKNYWPDHPHHSTAAALATDPANRLRKEPASSSCFASGSHRKRISVDETRSIATESSESHESESWLPLFRHSKAVQTSSMTSTGLSFDSCDHRISSSNCISVSTVEIIRDLNREILTLQSELTLRDNCLEAMRRENANLRLQLEAAKAAAGSAQEEMQSLRKQAETCTAQAENALTDLEAVRRRYGELETSVYGKRVELKDYEKNSVGGDGATFL